MKKKVSHPIHIGSIFRDLLKNFWFIVLAAVLGAVLAEGLYHLVYVPAYTSSVTVAVRVDSPDDTIYDNLHTASEMAAVFAQVTDSELMRTTVADDMQTETLDAALSARVLGNTNLITLSATAQDPATAFQAITSVKNNYSAVFGELFTNASFSVVEKPRTAYKASNSLTPAQRRTWGGLPGGLLGFGAILLRSIKRSTIKTQADAKRMLNAACVASITYESCHKKIPAKFFEKNQKILLCNENCSFRLEESIRQLHFRIETMREKKIFVFTSAAEKEGNSTVTANCALSLAREGSRVLLVDANLRKPAQYKLFDCPERTETQITLAEYLADERQADLAAEKIQGLYVLMSYHRQSDVAELLGSPRMRTLLEEFGKKMDYILIDTPPVNDVADAAILTMFADGVVLVVREDFCSADAINQAIATLTAVGDDKLVGCVLNRTRSAFGFGIRRHDKDASHASREAVNLS